MENQELEMAYNYAQYTHRNIFLTGKAGTGPERGRQRFCVGCKR